MIGQGQACGLSHSRTTEESRGEKSLEEERHEVESMYCHYFLPAFRTSFTVELIECWCFLVTSGFGKGWCDVRNPCSDWLEKEAENRMCVPVMINELYQTLFHHLRISQLNLCRIVSWLRETNWKSWHWETSYASFPLVRWLVLHCSFSWRFSPLFVFEVGILPLFGDEKLAVDVWCYCWPDYYIFARYSCSFFRRWELI